MASGGIWRRISSGRSLSKGTAAGVADAWASGIGAEAALASGLTALATGLGSGFGSAFCSGLGLGDKDLTAGSAGATGGSAGAEMIVEDAADVGIGCTRRSRTVGCTGVGCTAAKRTAP